MPFLFSRTSGPSPEDKKIGPARLIRDTPTKVPTNLATVVDSFEEPVTGRRARGPLRQFGATLPLTAAERQALLGIGDAIAGTTGCVMAYALWERMAGLPLSVPKLGPTLFAAAWVVALCLVDGYDVQIPASRVRSMVAILKALPVTSFFGSFMFFAQPYRMARPVILFSLLFGLAALVTTRWTIARLLLHERFAKRAILVATGQPSPVLAEALRAARFEYKIIGSVGPDRATVMGCRYLGPVDTLAGAVESYNVDEVILGPDHDPSSARPVEACFNRGIRVLRAVDLFERYLGRVPLEWVDENWFASLPAHDLYNRPYLIVRRLVDVLLAATLSIPFAVILPLLALLIKIDSPGPTFYRQCRLGQYGRLVHILKLRTMRSDAELLGHRWAVPQDPRVTRVGKILRLTRLDEFPQLLNVLKGEMSFIGPRPERPEFMPELEQGLPHYRARLAVKPGISGWAQVKGGYASSQTEAVRKHEYDMYYVKHQSLRLDLQIVIHTVFTILGFRGR